jgi:hypothetical protein
MNGKFSVAKVCEIVLSDNDDPTLLDEDANQLDDTI